VELQVPQQVSESVENLQIVNSRPGLNYTLIHI
jgi:hypothetical protein